MFFEGRRVKCRKRKVCLLPSLKVRDEVYLKANLEGVDVEGATVRERNSRRI